jgi:hypothetical protein
MKEGGRQSWHIQLQYFFHWIQEPLSGVHNGNEKMNRQQSREIRLVCYAGRNKFPQAKAKQWEVPNISRENRHIRPMDD